MLRERLGLPLDKKIIITVGRNHPKKGYKFIPEIVEYLSHKRRDFLWIMVGKGNETIEDAAKEKQLEQYLKVIPAIGISKEGAEDLYTVPSTDLIALYKAADIFAFPTLIESFGLVNIEAMAAGLPVVVTDAPGCRELVIHGYNGLLSPVGDTMGMANNILEVLEDDHFRNRLIANGLKEARKYEWKNIAEKYVNCYQQAVAHHNQSKERLQTVPIH
jgi:glycosyltransferase involved in cell wall biosynthesis